jgi:hypothetical protein
VDEQLTQASAINPWLVETLITLTLAEAAVLVVLGDLPQGHGDGGHPAAIPYWSPRLLV